MAASGEHQAKRQKLSPSPSLLPGSSPPSSLRSVSKTKAADDSNVIATPQPKPTATSNSRSVRSGSTATNTTASGSAGASENGIGNTIPSGSSLDSPKRSSWYTKTWPRKSLPLTQVARESISSASVTAVETAAAIKDKVTPASSRKSSLALTLGRTSSAKALPSDAATTKDHAIPESRHTSRDESALQDSSVSQQPQTQVPNSISKDTAPVANGLTSSSGTAATQDKPENPSQSITAPRSWIGWLAGGNNEPTNSSNMPKAAEPTKSTGSEASSSGENSKSPATSDPSASTAEPQSLDTQNVDQTVSDHQQRQREQLDSSKPRDEQSDQESKRKIDQRRSWLPIWNTATAVTAAQSAPDLTSPSAEPALKQPQSSQTAAPVEQPPVQVSEVPAPDKTHPSLASEQPPGKSSAWVFWSRDSKPGNNQDPKDVTKPEPDETAAANTVPTTKPNQPPVRTQDVKSATTLSEDSHPSTSKSASASASASASKLVDLQSEKQTKKRSRPSNLSNESIDTSRAAATTKVANKSATATAVAPTDAKAVRPASPVPQKKTYHHHLAPTLHKTLKTHQDPTLFQQLARLFYTPSAPTLTHLNLVKDSPRIKNALAIGVHGYFPTPLIQSVLGRPTGTSIKFADMAAAAIQRYAKSQKYQCNVKTAALQGEGRIAERIDLLWKLLLGWIDEIRKSDFVLVACHSQGVPVAIMLVAKLIHFGCIASTTRVGICAMAGVSMGPFSEYKSRWISGSAGELFEFSDPASKVSKDYLAALDDVLRFGVRLTYVGSIDDQLVSLESSVFAPVTHPHIFRAVSIDNRLHAPSFLSHLVAFALKLRNLGVQDHGLIRELSAPLAGSLYTGEGHSRLYEDDAIYDLAVAFAIETTTLPGMPLTKRDVPPGSNPYILPFAMRGILEEDFVKSELRVEVTQLLQQFDDWNPTTKALKDVKFRLEGIRSKL